MVNSLSLQFLKTSSSEFFRGVVSEEEGYCETKTRTHRHIELLESCNSAWSRFHGKKFSSLFDLGAMNKFGRQQVSTELKPFHHIRLDCEFKLDCEMWRLFLQGSIRGINRPFVNFSVGTSATILDFYTDAAKGLVEFPRKLVLCSVGARLH